MNGTNFEVKEYCGTNVNISHKTSLGYFHCVITPLGHRRPHVEVSQDTSLRSDDFPWENPELSAPSFGSMDIDFAEMFIACLTAGIDVYKTRLKYVGEGSSIE